MLINRGTIPCIYTFFGSKRKRQHYLRNGNICTKENVDLDACLLVKNNMGWLWHRRLAHIGMKNLHKLLKGEQVLGQTDVCFEKDKPCAACQAGK
jgi:hypothetical protein